jgi:preprotein translocase subunit SecA
LQVIVLELAQDPGVVERLGQARQFLGASVLQLGGLVALDEDDRVSGRIDQREPGRAGRTGRC